MHGNQDARREVITCFRKRWGSFPERIADIPELSFPSFAALRSAIEGRQVVLQRFSVEDGRMTMREHKKVYNGVIYRGAFSSELSPTLRTHTTAALPGSASDLLL